MSTFLGIDTTSLSNAIPAILVGIGGLTLGMQQLVKRWKTTSAENTVLTLLHSELERMATQNKLLSSYVHSLQLEAAEINSRLGKLQVENEKLHAEIAVLTEEIVSLQEALNKKGK